MSDSRRSWAGALASGARVVVTENVRQLEWLARGGLRDLRAREVIAELS